MRKLLFLIIICFGLVIVNLPVYAGKNTDVGAIVKLNQVNLTVHPEKRIPATGNWSTTLRFQIRNCITSSVLYSYNNITTNTSGQGTINIPNDQLINPDNYGFAVKGLSHLTKEYNCQIFADNVAEILDFTAEGDLLAGDTSNSTDDYINSLDLSNTLRNIYTSDAKHDLNQDSTVNSLDISNLIFNIFLGGD